MKIEITIEIARAEHSGKLANIFICFNDEGRNQKVQIKQSDFEKIHDFTGDTSSIAFDFFIVATIIYGIDDLFARKKWSFNGWTREFEVIIPVNHLSNWNSQKEDFSEAITFLTGDIWTISFRQNTERVLYTERAGRRQSKIRTYLYTEYSFVSLFSGGLDSLIGVIDKLEGLPDNSRGLLVSQFDPAYSGPKSDQSSLIGKFNTPYADKFTHLRATIGLSNVLASGDKYHRDGNQRSRSILFIGLGVYLLNKVPNSNELLIPENGTISLNHPLTPSRNSSLSTRTTHPYFLQSLEDVLNAVGVDVILKNPFTLNTKGEMVENCLNQTVLASAYPESASCGKRGHRRYWHNRNAKQCGSCMPCIYRRASLHRNDWDNELYGDDFLSITDMNSVKPDVRALLDYLRQDLSLTNIKRNLLVNGSIKETDLADLSSVVINSREEIKNWIRAKGSNELKLYLSLND